MPGCVNRKVIATLNCAESVRARFAIRGESWLPVGKGALRRLWAAALNPWRDAQTYSQSAVYSGW